MFSFLTVLSAYLFVGCALAQTALAADETAKSQYTVRYFVFVGTPPQGHKQSKEVAQNFKLLQDGAPVSLNADEKVNMNTIKSLLPGYAIKKIAHGATSIVAGETLPADSDPAATLVIGKTSDEWNFSLNDEFAISQGNGKSLLLYHRGNLEFTSPGNGSPAVRGRGWDLMRNVEFGQTISNGIDHLANGDVVVYCYSILSGGAR